MSTYPKGLIFATVGLLFMVSSVVDARRNLKMKTAGPSSWSDAGHTISPRYLQAATALTSEKILFTGGDGYQFCATTEFYYPSTGKWTAGTNMNDCRWYHTSLLLTSGKVLVAGGYIEEGEDDNNARITLNGAELFDPATGGWTRTGSLHQERHTHIASILPNGKVLVAGGADTYFLDSAELYDPTTGNWSITTSMQWKRMWHAATSLANGHVLVTGGYGEGGALKSVEMYNSTTGTWRNVSSMNYPRYGHTATLLTNGKVLVIGGVGSDGYVLKSTELFNPSTGTWTISGDLNTQRSKHTASLLRNGKVLVAGGGSLGGDVFPGFNPVNSAEMYDPATSVWTYISSMHYTRTWHTASVLENGNVLVVGGNLDDDTSAYTPELYNASSNTFHASFLPLKKFKAHQSIR